MMHTSHHHDDLQTGTMNLETPDDSCLDPSWKPMLLLNENDEVIETGSRNYTFFGVI